MVRLAAGHDLGLSGEPGHTVNNQIALGNKIFTYLLAGVPAVISDVRAHRTFTANAGGAVRLYPADNPAGLASELDMLLGDPAALAAARDVAWRLGQERFNWDVERVELLKLISGSLSRPVEATLNEL